MATINFPTVNLNDPVDTQTYTEAGITWTWNAHLRCMVFRPCRQQSVVVCLVMALVLK